MNLLTSLFDRAKALLTSRPAGTAIDAVPAGTLDRLIYDDLLTEAPALAGLVDELNDRHAYTHDLVRDVLMSFYQDRLQVRGKDEMDATRLHNWAVASGIQQSPDTPVTREYTVHSKYGAAMATISAGNAIRDLLANRELEEQAEDAQDKQQACDQAMRALQQALADAATDPDGQGAALEAAIGAAEGAQQVADAACQAAQETAEKARLKMQGPLHDAVQAAGEELRGEEELFRAWGVTDGEVKLWSFTERQAFVKLFRESAVTQYAKLLGAFRYAERAKRAKRVRPGRDEMYAITRSGRLNDVLSSEFAKLSNPITRLEFLDKLANGQLLSHEYRGEEKAAGGAMVFVVDTSDSMNWKRGGPVTAGVWSKAFMLACLQRAQADKRDFVGIIFSSRGQVETYHFPKGQGPIAQVVEMVSKSFNGGTDFETPMDAAMDVLEAQFTRDGACQGDVVFVTDDDCAVTDDWFEKYQERKARLGFRTWGIAVPKHRAGGTLTKLSDNARGVDSFVSAEPVLDLLKAI